jgi:hypothetical protein
VKAFERFLLGHPGDGEFGGARNSAKLDAFDGVRFRGINVNGDAKLVGIAFLQDCRTSCICAVTGLLPPTVGFSHLFARVQPTQIRCIFVA